MDQSNPPSSYTLVVKKAFGIAFMVCLTLAWAAPVSTPFLGTQSRSRADLERKFLHTPFCKAFACQTRPLSPMYQHLVFKLSNGLEVELDTWHANGLYFNLEPKKPPSLEAIRTMRALIRLATGQDLPFDFAKNCSSIVQIQKSKPLEFRLKPPKQSLGQPLGRWGRVACLEDKTGIPAGQENTAPEFVPSYTFAVVLPV
jgi:hypothetical protein